MSGKSELLLERLSVKLGSYLLEAWVDRGDAMVRIAPGNILDLFRLLKLDAELSFDFLVDITVVDWMDSAAERFEVVYQLLSLRHSHRLRVKVWLPESKPEIPSITPIWHSALFLEREAWDMFGVVFSEHPDLRRILMYDEFKGHPLRKDYPVQAKQPRIKLRAPEVQNTARLMERPDLVQIKSRKSVTGGQP